LRGVPLAPLVEVHAGRFNLRDWQIASGELIPLAGAPRSGDARRHRGGLSRDASGGIASDHRSGAAQHRDDRRNRGRGDRAGRSRASAGPVRPRPGVARGRARLVRGIGAARRGASARDGIGCAAGRRWQRTCAAGCRYRARSTSRDEIARMLDKACEYFHRYEPSSPVPLLLERAKRLMSKDFVEILRDLAPDGIAQFEVVSGINRENGA